MACSRSRWPLAPSCDSPGNVWPSSSGALAATLNGRAARVERFRADLWLIDGHEVTPAPDAKDASGRVDALVLDGGRIKRVKFARVR